MIDVNEKPKPCPFCGGNAEITGYSKDEWVVACRNNIECRMLPTTTIMSSMQEAISIWNDRWDTDKALELCGKAMDIINRQGTLPLEQKG